MGVESYLLPRVDDPADAADALAETFLVAWRHLEEVPCGVDARPWLLAVARVPVSAASTSPDPGPHRVSGAHRTGRRPERPPLPRRLRTDTREKRVTRGAAGRPRLRAAARAGLGCRRR